VGDKSELIKMFGIVKNRSGGEGVRHSTNARGRPSLS